MKWSYVDLKRSIITFPAEVMKAGRERRIPITEQMKALLLLQKEMYKHGKGNSTCEYVFPNLIMTKNKRNSSKESCGKKSKSKELEYQSHQSSRPVYKLFAKCNLKGRIVPHGFRSIGRTWMESRNIKHAVAEMCLAHSVKSATEAAYNRTDYLKERRKALQQWNDYLCTHLNALDEICKEEKKDGDQYHKIKES